jgi:3-oxoadipate enol-lactonase
MRSKGGAAVQFARVNGVVIHHQVIGAAEGKPLIVFSNSVGTDFRIWRDVVVRLAGDFTILCYDSRGHGLSDTGATPYTLDDQVGDLAALMDHLGFKSALICGLSVGGMVAQALQAVRPDLVAALVLCATGHKIGTTEFWNARIAAVESEGIASIADQVFERWFTPAFRETVEFAGYRNMLIRQPVAGYAATCAALREADLTKIAARIDAPAICIAGEADGATPPALVAELAKLIPGAHYELIQDAAHIVPVEQPEILTEIIRGFAALVSGAPSDARQTH